MNRRSPPRPLHVLSLCLCLGASLVLSPRPNATLARGATPAALGPVPTNCPTNPPPTTIDRFFGTASGMRPVWVIGFSPGLSLRMGPSSAIAHGPHGWYDKVAWIVAPNYRQHITLRGSAMAGGTPLWFQIGGQPPSTRPVLDPRYPEASAPNEPAGWAAFPSYIFIPRAGCYVVEADWPGGMWRLAFAAGQSAVVHGT
jgi:hypothetical protein